MGIIYDGVKCDTIDQLEELIIDLDDYQKQCLRNDFYGIENQPQISWDCIKRTRLELFYKHNWRVERYQTQQAANIQTTESPEKFLEICLYLQDLRDITETFQTPAQVVWPTEP